MNVSELIKRLDDRFGNPLGPRQYAIVREAIDMLRLMEAENEALTDQAYEAKEHLDRMM
jgi:hypothetical protein